MRVKVDFDLCEANALCVGIVPEVFAMDDDDGLQILQEEPAPELRARLDRAALTCPRSAITIED